jgi:hypothetical protein
MVPSESALYEISNEWSCQYVCCRVLTGPEFQIVIVKIVNVCMLPACAKMFGFTRTLLHFRRLISGH